jgi:hypothetical protein
MNLSTKIGTLILASAMSMGVSTNSHAQPGGLSLSGNAVTIGTAVGIGLIGALAIRSAGNDNFDAPLPRGDGFEPSGGSQSTFDTTTTN